MVGAAAVADGLQRQLAFVPGLSLGFAGSFAFDSDVREDLSVEVKSTLYQQNYPLILDIYISYFQPSVLNTGIHLHHPS